MTDITGIIIFLQIELSVATTLITHEKWKRAYLFRTLRLWITNKNILRQVYS